MCGGVDPLSLGLSRLLVITPRWIMSLVLASLRRDELLDCDGGILHPCFGVRVLCYYSYVCTVHAAKHTRTSSSRLC